MKKIIEIQYGGRYTRGRYGIDPYRWIGRHPLAVECGLGHMSGRSKPLPYNVGGERFIFRTFFPPGGSKESTKRGGVAQQFGVSLYDL